MHTVELVGSSVDGPVVVLGGVSVEVVWDGERQVQAQAGDEDVARRVHVCELELGDANSGYEAEHDTEQAAHHRLGQRGKNAPKLACNPHRCAL